MSGYDKFFKEAGKASGLMTGRPAPKAKASTKSQSQFKGSAEDRLRQEVALRARNRKAVAARKRKAFPVFPAIVAVISIISCTIGFVRPDLADRLLSHVEIGAFGKANAAEKADAKKSKAVKPASEAKPVASIATATATAADPTLKPAPVLEAAKAGVTPDIRTWTPDELSFFNKLDDRKKELDLRESELAKLEEELQKQKAELDEKIKQLEGMRADISKTLKTRVAVDQEKVDKLVQFYSTMKPQQAAKVIESLNEDLAVEVIDKMKKKSAAEIMNALDPKKARRISELMTGYQRSPAAEAEDKTEN